MPSLGYNILSRADAQNFTNRLGIFKLAALLRNWKMSIRKPPPGDNPLRRAGKLQPQLIWKGLVPLNWEFCRNFTVRFAHLIANQQDAVT